MLIGWILISAIFLLILTAMALPFIEFRITTQREDAERTRKAAEDRRRSDAAFLRAAQGTRLATAAAKACPGLLRWPDRLDVVGHRLLTSGFTEEQARGAARRADGSHWNVCLPSHPVIAEMSEGHLSTLLILEALTSPDWPGVNPHEKTCWANVLFPPDTMPPILSPRQVLARPYDAQVDALVALVGHSDALLVVAAGLTLGEAEVALAGEGLDRDTLTVMAALRGCVTAECARL